MKNFNLIEMAKAMKEHKLRHMWRYAAMMALLLTLACGQAWGDDYTETYSNPTGTNTPARANGMGAFSTIGSVTGDVSFGNSSLQINTNAGSGTFTVSSTDGSYIESITFTQQSSYPINTLTSSQGTVTGPTSNVFTFTPNSATLTSATFSMSAQSSKKVRLAPIVVNLTSDYEYFSKNFSISSGTVSCTKSNAKTDVTITSTGGTSNNGLTLASSGNALTIASSGHNIKAVHFTCESHNTMSNLSANTGTYSSNGWTKSTATNTVTFTSSGSNATIVGISVELEAGCTSISPSLSYTSTSLMVGDDSSSPTLTGNTGSGTVTWTSSDEDVATVNESTGVVTAVAAGTATITASIAANGGYCNGSATANFTITRDPVGEDHVLTWPLTTVSGSSESNVDGGTTDIGTGTAKSTSSYITNQTDLTGVGVKRTTTGKNDNTGKIETPTSYDAAKYVSFTFDVEDGYQFTPTEVSIKTVAVTTAKDLKFEFSDANGSYSVTKANLSINAAAATNTLDFSSCDRAFTGTVTVKIYVYGANDTYRLSTPLTITGDVAAAVAGATYKLKGDWDSWTEHTMDVSAGVASYSIDLPADTRYEFCFMENSTIYKNNGTVLAPISNWDFSTSANNAHIHTGPAGTYTFSMNTSNHKVSVTYPDVTHPSDHYVYFKNTSVWETVYAYLANSGNDNKAAAWPGCPTPTTTICGETYHYAAMNDMSGTYNLIIFNNGGSGSGNQSWNLPTTGSAGNYNANANANWYDPSYDITFDANGGSGTMDKVIAICSGDNKTLPANTFTREGWEFDGWNTNKYGTGTSYDDEGTVSGVSSNITLYAKWKKTVYFKVGAGWDDSSAWYAIYYFDNNADSNNGWVGLTTAASSCETDVFKGTLPGNGYDRLIVCRMDGSKAALDWGSRWNQTGNIEYSNLTSNNQFTPTNLDGNNCTGTWGTYSVPTYTVSAAASTVGYGTVSAASVTGVACGTSISTSTNTLTVGATTVTATQAESTAQYTYAFTNWTWSPAGSTVTSDVTATANFTRTLNSYTVTWKNGSTTLETDASVDYGETPTYDGSTPTKDADALYTYTFSGWSPAIGTVTGDATYSAQFTATPKTVAYGDATIYAYNDSKRVVSGTRKTAMETALAGSDGETDISGSLPLLHSVAGLTSVVLAGQCKSEVKASFPWLGSYIKMKTASTTATITFNVASGYVGTATIYFSGYNKTATLTNGANSDAKTSDSKNPETEGSFTSKNIALVSGANTLTISGNNGYISRIDVALESSCTTPTIAWSTSPTNGNVGGNMTISVTSNYPAGVTITSNNSNATLSGRTVDGSTVSYTLNYAVAGNANITASVDGDGSTVCDETVNLDAVAITISKNTPTKYDFSVDKTVLCGEETATLTLEDSEDGVTYELREDSSHPIAETQKTGTGSALTWTGLGAGTYVVYAVADATYIERQMDGSKITVSAGMATSITTQPTNQEVTVGEEATLTVVAAGTSLSYQWKESATEDGTYSNVSTGSGKTSASYSVTPAAAGTKWYKCVVTGTCGEVTTEARKIVANEAVTYTVTYEYNGATSGDETESATGASVSLPNPTKEGYTLQGWYTSSGSLAGAATATYNPTSDITLYALWREDACAGGGGGSTTIFSISGMSWSAYSAENGTITIYPTGTPDETYTATLVGASTVSIVNTNSDGKSKSMLGANSIKIGGNAVSMRFTLTSGTLQNGDVISFTNSGSNQLSFTTTAERSTAYATTSDTYTIEEGDGLAGSSSLYVWRSTSSSTEFTAFTITRAGGSGTCYYVTYNGNGADGGFTKDEASHASGSDVTVKTNSFTKTGYTFNGWNTDPDGEGGTAYAEGETISSIAGNMTLYAQWAVEVACSTDPTVTAGSNSSVTSTTATVSCESGISAIGDGCSISSYGFVVGTSTNPEIGGVGVTQHEVGTSYASTGASFSQNLTGLTKNTTYYVRPYATNSHGTAYGTQTSFTTLATYTVTYNDNGATSGDAPVDASSPYDAGSNVTVLGNTGELAKTNYTFDGWATANDGTGTSYAAAGTISSIAANTTLYAKWKQTVTLKTGAQGSGADQTPYVYINGTGVSSFTAHTADGYTLQGYYTAGSGGVKVLNANGTFAAANVTDYITSSKWSRTGAAPTLYAQWVASEDCSTSDFVIKKGDDTEYQGCMESSSYNGTATSFTAGSPTTVGKAKMTISNYDGGIKRPGSGNTFSIVIEPVSGYYLKSVCWAGKVENDETVSYYWDDNSGSATTITPQTTSGTGVTYNAPSSTTKFTASYVDDGDKSGGIWWRNVQVEVCAEGGTTYNVTYDGNDKTSGDVPTDATNYSYGDAVTVKGNTGSLEKTNYTFAGWTTNDDGTGSSYVADNTFSITANTTLYAKWTQTVTLDKNGGSTDGSATAVWNATGLTGITHAKPAAGYKLLGYYSASSDGTKVLNSDGSFAATNVIGYITSGKWSRTSATTLYAEYESAGALTWNLIVNSDTANLSTSTKTSAFTEISTTNMTNAALVGGLTYEKSKKSALTGKISTPAHDADKYVKVTFQVASGYKFIPSLISVPIQPVGDGEHKAVELSLTDTESHSLVSGSATKCDGTVKGKTTTVTLAGDGSKFFEGTVTLKIYVYPHASATASSNNCYRLGTPITIEGEIEEACGTMPSYTSMSYTTTTFAPGADASGSPITIVGGENIDTYQWKYNKVNDRTSGTNCGTGTSLTSLTPLTDEDAATDGTRYYWCEMTNTSCGITIKSPAVAITVAAAKSDASVTWTNPESTPNYGGGGYTIKATVDQTGWDGNAADLVITAPAGIRIYNVSSGTTSSQKWVQADFDVQTSFDRSTYASNIPFTVSAAATATYNAISDDHNVSYSACSGGGVGSSYNIRVRKNYDKDASNNYRWVTPGTGEITYAVGSSISSGKAGTAMATVFDSIMSSDKQYIWVKTFVGNIKQMRLYVETSGANVSVSALYQRTTYAAADAKDVITGYSVVYDEDDDAENTGTKGQHTIDLIFTSALSANDIICVKFSSSKVKALGAAITEGSAGSLNTYLQWSGDLEDGATVDKYTTDAYFTYSASKITENTNTLGAITYSSSVPSVATVDATGKVALIAAGSTTIKATLAASGCYKKAEISYTLNVTEVPCAITAGTLTLTSGTESKCSGDDVTLTLTGFESGASIQWKDGDTDVNHNGSTYKIATAGTTSTLTTNQPGTYSVIVTKGCFVRSNRITISNISATASVTKIVDEWYVKNGRLTPDIELWSLSEGATLKSVAWSPDNETGLSCVARGGVIYLEGKSPSSNESGDDIEYTLTATITDECNADHEETTKTIKITHQKNTDKHVLAFVVNGTAKGGFTEGITAAQTTSVGLYNAIAAQFDVQATNIYATDDEKKLKEYYSQYDILCITDYPNTQTKGANSKSYVDAIGSLIDIRPILTMEAFVSKLANWKAKGISGNPKSPSTRQYTMDLQCKDHEIFAGTDLTKVGEGDEAMYRVSMVDNTKEDYATLDATYGAILPHKEKESKSGAGDGEYNYGGKPALQGFTFTQEMSDNDLLPIGLIDDGAGNPLQVGIERQHNMEARLMVLGINSYAMERLTDDGEQVVINALNYLMKKNAEDIADCSIYFTGGDEDEDESTRYNWNVDSHWSNGTQPISTQKVRILAKCVIPSGTQVHVTDVLIVPNGPINHGADVAKGSLTIEAGGALIVDGKVEETTAPNYFHPHATSAENLVLKTSSSAQAALIFDNEEAETQATVNLYSLGRKPSSYQYQYFAVPMEVVPVNPVFANETHGGTGIYTYVYSEATSGWTRRKYYDDLFAFEGLGITTKSTGAMNYTMTGNLASTATKEITLTHDGAGLNLVGNSWMAPIQIGALAEDNADANITKTVYIYCAGRDADEGAVISSDDTETAGQWLAVPFEAAEFATWKATGKLSVIPAMQAFEINVSAEATLTLDYDKVVRGSTNDLNAKLRAPGRRMAANEVTMTNIRVADSKTHTDLSLFEGDRFSEAFDNGWEAEYMTGDGRSAKLYAETEAGQMAVAAMYDYEGTVVGFAPGQETEYTFSFMGEDNGYYLNDIKLHNSVRISEGETYTFTYEEGDTENRFYISRTAINAPEVATGMENLDAAAPKVQKIIYNDKLYIIRGGRLYDATGKVVK